MIANNLLQRMGKNAWRLDDFAYLKLIRSAPIKEWTDYDRDCLSDSIEFLKENIDEKFNELEEQDSTIRSAKQEIEDCLKEERVIMKEIKKFKSLLSEFKKVKASINREDSV